MFASIGKPHGSGHWPWLNNLVVKDLFFLCFLLLFSSRLLAQTAFEPAACGCPVDRTRLGEQRYIGQLIGEFHLVKFREAMDATGAQLPENLYDAFTALAAKRGLSTERSEVLALWQEESARFQDFFAGTIYAQDFEDLRKELGDRLYEEQYWQGYLIAGLCDIAALATGTRKTTESKGAALWNTSSKWLAFLLPLLLGFAWSLWYLRRKPKQADGTKLAEALDRQSKELMQKQQALSELEQQMAQLSRAAKLLLKAEKAESQEEKGSDFERDYLSCLRRIKNLEEAAQPSRLGFSSEQLGVYLQQDAEAQSDWRRELGIEQLERQFRAGLPEGLKNIELQRFAELSLRKAWKEFEQEYRQAIQKYKEK